MATKQLTIIVAEEMSLVREGIVSLLARREGIDVVAQAGDGEQAWNQIRRLKPETALLDLSLERMHAFEVIRQVRSEGIPTRTVILSARRDRKTVLEALRAGAQGFLLKAGSTQNLYDCLEQVRAGGVYVSPEVNLQEIFAPNRTEVVDPLETLSAREYQVFTLMVEGVRAKEIAARLNLSPKTVDTYRASMMRKLNIHDVATLVKYAIQKHLTTSD